ncbi:hypothetical protein E0500_010285 [Streptomyces sp. KM273126]|uniref:hypothetical protein n=1 Tax=Streptomyces sp. KM273126 TaxID=2545247 RepID=UPI0010401666|nr:hypothetical protein [Streptomyces sp. KM273126]MBA2807787.1 hypothetical protein [Streptomyces sp. KM273126]
MSTPSTSDPRRQRRNPLTLPSPRRGDQRRTAGRQAPLPRTRVGGTTVLSDQAERKLLDTARAMGGKAAKRGVLDPWILQSGDRVPYFAELASVRDRVVGRIGEEAGLTEEQARLDDARAESDVTRCEADTELIQLRLREAEEQITTAKDQLDLLAQRANRWNRFRDGIRARLETRWMETTFPAAPSPRPRDTGDRDQPTSTGSPATVPAQGQRAASSDDEGPDVLQSVPRTGEAPRPADSRDTAPHTVSVPVRGLRDQLRPATTDAWEGLTKRPGIPAWMNWTMLLVILLVELPIYYAAFEPFHGIGAFTAQAQTVTLSAAAAIVMVFLPHLAGRMLRWRASTGSVRSSWVPGFALLGVWAALTVLLGTLRAKYLMQEEDGPEVTGDVGDFQGVDSGTTPSLIDRLDLAPGTVTAMFCALLLLSGGIGLLLGLFREHGFLDAYRTAVERRAELVARRQESIAATERARATVNTGDARREDRRQATEDRVRAVLALYDAAAAAYLDGVATRSGDPAVTEAAMKLARSWPLLPAPARR